MNWFSGFAGGFQWLNGVKWSPWMAALALVVSALTAGYVTIRAAKPNEDPGIVIIIPTEDPQVSQGRDGVGPVRRMVLQARVAAELAKKDKIPFTEAYAKVRTVGAEKFDACVSQAVVQQGVEGNVFGDGQGFLQRLVEWLKSPQGQAFIQLLLSLLLAAI